MKVLILITKSNWGGAQRYVYDLATKLAQKGYEVEVMAGGNGRMIEKLKEKGIKCDGSLPIGRDVSVFDDIKIFFHLIKILRNKRPDIVHVNSSKMGGVGSLAGRLVGIKSIIFTAHGWAFNEDRGFIQKNIIKFLHWLTIVFSHKTIAVSNALREQLILWPFISEKISVVHNGIETEAGYSKVNARLELVKSNPKLYDLVKTSKNLTIVGSVGELHHVKGLNYAIKSMVGIKENLIYLILGTGEEKDRIQKLIVDSKLESVVYMLGYVNNASQYLKAFDIFVLPSISEGLPYIMLEAGMSGLPIIATAVGGIPETIDDMKSGILIQPKKPQEIRNALEFYLKHKKTRKEHGLAFHDRVMKDFSLEKMIEDTIQVYKSNQ